LIEVSTGGHPLLQPGESCSLEEAYCRKTIERDEPLSVPDALADGWEDDPAYDTFELGAYVGAKITVDGELYGTLCFAATRPRSYSFSDAERTFIELMAQWVGREIERNRRRDELQRQLERLDQFASVVSHDLRNPLNVAMGNVAAVLDDEGGADALADAGAALDRMERLIEDLLALAREGKTVDETESVSLATAAEAAWPVLDGDEATLAVEGDLVLEADPSRLEQLLGNLFRNSIEHGDGAVTVRVGPTEDGFFVADDGPGFPEADRERVFDSGYTTAADGTGFGLAIVAEIAEAHGWSVRATESATGGAKVVIETTG
jgi:signal transduction histidine kinase